MKNKYIVVCKEGNVRICCEKGAPFIGNAADAKRLASFLKSVNPQGTYCVVPLGHAHKPVETDPEQVSQEAAPVVPKKTRYKLEAEKHFAV